MPEAGWARLDLSSEQGNFPKLAQSAGHAVLRRSPKKKKKLEACSQATRLCDLYLHPTEIN